MSCVAGLEVEACPGEEAHVLLYGGACGGGGGTSRRGLGEEEGWNASASASPPAPDVDAARRLLSSLFPLANVTALRDASGRRRALREGEEAEDTDDDHDEYRAYRTPHRRRRRASLIQRMGTAVFGAESLGQTAAREGLASKSLYEQSSADVEARMRGNVRAAIGDDALFPSSAAPHGNAVLHVADFWRVSSVAQKHAARRVATHTTYLSTAGNAWATKLRSKYAPKTPTAKAQHAGRRDLVNRGIVGLESLRVMGVSMRAAEAEGFSPMRVLFAAAPAQAAAPTSAATRPPTVYAAADARPWGKTPVAVASATLRRLLATGTAADDRSETAVWEGTAHASLLGRGAAWRGAAEAAEAIVRRATKRRALLVAAASQPGPRNIFVSPQRAACAAYLCPGLPQDTAASKCVIDRRTCVTPTMWTLSVGFDYGVLQASLFAASLDERVVLGAAFSCWDEVEADPQSNPFGLGGIGQNVLADHTKRWCFPMIAPFAFRFQRIDADVRQDVMDLCGPGTGCTCPAYYEGTYDFTNFWFVGVPFFELARFHDGLLSAQWFFSYYVTVPLGIGAVWSQTFGTLVNWGVPYWFAYLWSDQGQGQGPNAITYGTQLMCATVHIPSILYIGLFVIVVFCFFLSYMTCVVYTVSKLVLLAFLPVEAWTRSKLDALEVVVAAAAAAPGNNRGRRNGALAAKAGVVTTAAPVARKRGLIERATSRGRKVAPTPPASAGGARGPPGPAPGPPVPPGEV